MDVVFLNPSFPSEMQDFCRALAHVGARVIGVGDGPPEAQSEKVRAAISGWIQVPSLLDEDDLVDRVATRLRGHRIDRVETCWEPLVLAAARLREALGASGMDTATTLGFRDKQVMKDRLVAAGLRVPKSARVRTPGEVRTAASEIGFPLILKPIAGAGSADTHRVDDRADLERAIDAMAHVDEASCEEFIEGEEYTYDTICIDGVPVVENVSQYLPRPLAARTDHDCSPVILTYRDLTRPDLAEGVRFGHRCLAALGMGTGFTHMEWYRTSRGEVVFGEIGCRPGGARLVDQMNFASDADHFVTWANAVCYGRVDPQPPKRYCTAIVFKRAQGNGVIRSIEGLEDFMQRHGEHVVLEELLRPGQHRRDWKQTLLSDGAVVVRHPDPEVTLALAREVGESVHLHASP